MLDLYYVCISKYSSFATLFSQFFAAFFIRPFYKMMLGKPITLNDMESVDNEYFNSLIYIKDNNPEDLDLHFAVDEDVFGKVTVFTIYFCIRSLLFSEYHLQITIQSGLSLHMIFSIIKNFILKIVL